ncbi:KinB-signaling pathway activation protein [Virgibacillus soli]|uniref:KinB-signaling pathway activation protein n=1 Tax=Paracerasibacillus soli TaxID=480284 RepID=A0ABU5CUS3_9BACI|nr:KinB-signaling pathway activation protein [Virgibacillus soli]MDY0410121.1 KinB-signaling pathway activation protein [Virgibacillus soli]
MNSRKIVGLFWKTLWLGGAAGLITSFFIEAEQYSRYLSPFNLKELLGVILFSLGLGLVFSVISQTGFFAYLFINRFGQGLFRSFWPTVQLALIAFVLFDLVYFPYTGASENATLLPYILVALGLLVFGILAALWKVKETNKRAFIPALFLMVVMTTLEWVPGLRTSGVDYKWLMIVPLLLCNAYQLMMLHRLQNKVPVAQGKASAAK